ncbi:hypothetical protein KIN20_020398 [Parelaphostrongylus tenuis]|uniref:Uncharacterized protein n=1 Tax=Parelaphostrongylus tenuis TaxID=148309 RepID=A0AAD5N5W3_PARTN|nr:hypothetical protein KIN20_020398 [Parelaphostrongylus tenuis]
MEWFFQEIYLVLGSSELRYRALTFKPREEFCRARAAELFKKRMNIENLRMTR